MEKVKEKNALHLDNQFFKTGFGEEDPSKLRALMAEGKQRFEFPLEIKYGSDTAKIVRNLSLSDKGNYFFNTYSVSVEREGAAPVKQTFYVRRAEKVLSQTEGLEHKEWINNTFTMKEAYNLLKGRPVLKDYLTKEGNHYKAWANLNFKKTDKYGNYEIEKKPYFEITPEISKLPIKDIEKPGVLERIVESVHKGNRQSVSLIAGNGKVVEMFVGPDLKNQSVSLYSQFNTRTLAWEAYIEKKSQEVTVNLAQNKDHDQANTVGSTNKEGVKTAEMVLEETSKKKTQTNRRGIDQNSEGESPLKSRRNKKGLSV